MAEVIYSGGVTVCFSLTTTAVFIRGGVQLLTWMLLQKLSMKRQELGAKADKLSLRGLSCLWGVCRDSGGVCPVSARA